ncbi:MAG: DUF2157 domain-containing protein [Demequinaceae bacterium]|nr:DUF2157 domain-containing protein [Demequinaceae bacterium]
MRELTARLNEWRSAGLITAKQVKDIASYERRATDQGPPAEGRSAPVAEAVGYVGAAIALAAMAILLGDRWGDLGFGGRLTIIGLLTLILAGAAFALRRTTAAPIQRLVSVLAVCSVGGAGWLTAVILTAPTGADWLNAVLPFETTSLHVRDIALSVALVMLALAAPLYFYRRRSLPQLAALACLLVVTGTVFARPAFTGGVTWGAIVIWAVGVAWVLLALGGWHRPSELAVASGSLVALIGMITAAAGDGRGVLLWLGLATAVALMWRGVVLDAFPMVAFGAIGVLVFVPQIILECFPQGSGAVIAMLITGLLLVVFAVGIARRRRGGSTPQEAQP